MELLYVSEYWDLGFQSRIPSLQKTATEIGWHTRIESLGHLYQRESDLTKKLYINLYLSWFQVVFFCIISGTVKQGGKKVQ